MKGDGGKGRGRVGKLCSGPRVTLLRGGDVRLTRAVWKVDVPKPEAAGPWFHPQPGHLLLCDPGQCLPG